MQTDYKVESGIGIVTVSPEMNAANVDNFKASFSNWLKDEKDLIHIVVDMGKIESIDSSGLGALLGALKLVAERGGDLRLCGLQKRVRIVFEITRAYKLFQVYENTAEAVASF